MRTHPGVGLLTALAMVHTLDTVTRFNRARQVAAYYGLDPREHSSGDTQRYGHISKQGNRLLRYLLVEAAHSAVRREEELRGFYRRLLACKNSAVAIVAVGGGWHCAHIGCYVTRSTTTSSGAGVEKEHVPPLVET